MGWVCSAYKKNGQRRFNMKEFFATPDVNASAVNTFF